jgi:hypothetical protein
MTESHMLRLAKAFLDIAFWRQTPAHLPASLLLLAIVAAASALLDVLGALLPPGPNGPILLTVVLGVGLPLAFTGIVLKLARRPQRFLQTASALLGVGVLAEILLYPLGTLLSFIGIDGPVPLLVRLLLNVGVIWYLLACAHIWRTALESGLLLGGVISVGYLILSIALEQQIMPLA